MAFRTRFGVLLTVAIVAAFACAASARADSITDLGAITPLGINNSDQVVGDVTDQSGNLHAALWNGTLQQLGQLTGTDQSDAYAISAGGRIAGDEFGSTSAVHGVYWNGGGTANEVGPFQGVSSSNDDTVLNDVDTAGDLVGITPESSSNYSITGFEYHAGAEVEVGQGDLGAQPGGTDVGAITPNGAVMLGDVSTGTTTYYLWSTASPSGPGVALNFTPPVSDARGLAGIEFGDLIDNDLASDGTVLGYTGTSAARANYLRLPSGTELPVSGLFHANAVNASHVVVGDILGTSQADPLHAAMWTNGVVTNLNTLLPPGSGWDLIDALAINNDGDIVGVGAHDGQDEGFLLSTAATVSIKFGAISALQVGKVEQVPVTVTAGAVDLSSLSLGEGITVSGNQAKVEQQASGISGFSLGAGQSRTFTFTLRGVAAGQAGLSVNVAGSSARGNVTDSDTDTVDVFDPQLGVTAIKTPSEAEPSDAIEIKYRGVGWNPTGGQIDLKFGGENAGQQAQAAIFDGSVKIRRWPERTTDDRKITDHSDGGYCWGELAGTQGSLSAKTKIEGKWGGWVLWSANPEIKAHEAWCEGEEDTFFAKSPQPIVAMGLYKGSRGGLGGLGVKVYGSDGAGTASPLILLHDGHVLSYFDRPRDTCVGVSVDHRGQLITTVTRGACN